MARPPMEVPVAPTDVTVAASSRLWTVSWKSTSAWNNQDTLQFYDWLYQVELDGDIVGYSWPETEYVLDGDWVSPGEHTLRIRAVNRFGPGAWSSPATFSTEPSGPVTDLVAAGRFWGARLTWTAPTTTEAAASYVVTRRFGIRNPDEMPGADSGVGLTTPTSQFEALDLEPGRNYTFAVFAVDDQGQVSDATVTHLVRHSHPSPRGRSTAGSRGGDSRKRRQQSRLRGSGSAGTDPEGACVRSVLLLRVSGGIHQDRRRRRVPDNRSRLAASSSIELPPRRCRLRTVLERHLRLRSVPPESAISRTWPSSGR